MTTCYATSDGCQHFGYKRNPRNKTYSGMFDLMETKNNFEIWSLWVLERYRHKGYGTKMLSEFISQFHFKKPLVLYVYKANEIAIKLYKKVGFVITGDCWFCSYAYEMQFVKEQGKHDP